MGSAASPGRPRRGRQGVWLNRDGRATRPGVGTVADLRGGRPARHAAAMNTARPGPGPSPSGRRRGGPVSPRRPPEGPLRHAGADSRDPDAGPDAPWQGAAPGEARPGGRRVRVARPGSDPGRADANPDRLASCCGRVGHGGHGGRGQGLAALELPTLAVPWCHWQFSQGPFRELPMP